VWPTVVNFLGSNEYLGAAGNTSNYQEILIIKIGGPISTSILDGVAKIFKNQYICLASSLPVAR